MKAWLSLIEFPSHSLPPVTPNLQGRFPGHTVLSPQVPGLEFQPPKAGSHLSAPLSQAYKAGLLHGVADTEQAVSFLLKATHNFPFTLRNK